MHHNSLTACRKGAVLLRLNRAEGKSRTRSADGIMSVKRIFIVISSLFLLLACTGLSFGSSDDRLTVGLNAFQDGFYSLAAKELWTYVESASDSPTRSEVLYILGQAEIAQENWAQAEKALKILDSSKNPEKTGEAGFWLGWVLAKQNKKNEALGQLAKYAKPGAAKYSDAVFFAANLAASLNNHSRAADILAGFIKSSPNSPKNGQAWLELIKEQMLSGNPDKAKASAMKALVEKSVQKDVEIFVTTAFQGIDAARKASDPVAEAFMWAFLAQGKGGEKIIERALFEEGAAKKRAGDNKGAKKTLSAYLEKYPTGPYAGSALMLLMDAAMEEKDNKSALAHAEAALALKNDPQIKNKLQELMQTAFSLALSVKDSARAVALAKELLKNQSALSPEMQGLVHHTLGVAEFESGGIDAAISHMDAVPKESSLFVDAKIITANYLIRNNRAGEALRRLTPLLQNDNVNGDLLLAALRAADESGNKKLAAELSVRTVDRRLIEDDDADKLLYRAASLQIELKDQKAAYQTFKKLAMGYPQSPYAPLAAFELQKKAYNDKDWESVILWSSIAKKQEDSALAAYLEAEALLKKNRDAEAAKAYSALSEKSSKYKGTALARLGSLLEKQGKGAEALAAYKKAVDAGIEGEVAAWVSKRLASFDEAAKKQNK